MSYAEQLKKPQWQRKRLEIMERDEWRCKKCEDTDSTLTVHHKSYSMVDGTFREIWDYKNDNFITLCEECHDAETRYLEAVKKDVFFRLRDACDSACAIDNVIVLIDTINRNIGRKVTDTDMHKLKMLAVRYSGVFDE